MKANSFGERFVVTTFGESHGVALGCIIDGCPAGVEWNEDILLELLKRRRPGHHSGEGSKIVSAREEKDLPEILSGVFEGKTLGTPIALVVRNVDARSADYDKVMKRAGHADDVWLEKFGQSDYRGGGRSSGRETLSRVLAGAVAQMLLLEIQPQMKVHSYISQIGDLKMTRDEHNQINYENLKQIDLAFPCAKKEEAKLLLEKAKSEGKSYGGTAHIVIENVLPFLGEPVFRKLKSDLAMGMMSLGATSAFEIGSGIDAPFEEGTNFHKNFESENYGGLRGGISTGEKIILKVHFKPTASVMDVAKKGRHDPCIVPRALPVLESMVNLILADQVLLRATNQVSFLRNILHTTST